MTRGTNYATVSLATISRVSDPALTGRTNKRSVIVRPNTSLTMTLEPIRLLQFVLSNVHWDVEEVAVIDGQSISRVYVPDSSHEQPRTTCGEAAVRGTIMLHDTGLGE